MRRDITCSARQFVPAHPVKVRLLGLDQEPLDGEFALGVLGTQRLQLLYKLLGDTAVGIRKLLRQGSIPAQRTRSR